jgi:hypothetical protein
MMSIGLDKNSPLLSDQAHCVYMRLCVVINSHTFLNDQNSHKSRQKQSSDKGMENVRAFTEQSQRFK